MAEALSVLTIALVIALLVIDRLVRSQERPGGRSEDDPGGRRGINRREPQSPGAPRRSLAKAVSALTHLAV